MTSRTNPFAPPADAAAWAARCRALAGLTLAEAPLPEADAPAEARSAFAASFRDERGHRRAVDGPVLARVLGVEPGPPPASAPPDVALWFAVAGGGPADPLALVAPGPGPLTPEDRDAAIEIWTETELASLHAFWHLARRAEADGDPRPRRRLEDAVAWHAETLQPDNATNHAWSVHVFAEAAVAGAGGLRDDARIHAETLLHAACLGSGRPDRFSAVLLLDAARALEALAGEG